MSHWPNYASFDFPILSTVSIFFFSALLFYLLMFAILISFCWHLLCRAAVGGHIIKISDFGSHWRISFVSSYICVQTITLLIINSDYGNH